AAEVRRDFAGQFDGGTALLRINFDGVVDLWKLIFGEFDVESGTDDLGDFSGSGHCGVLVRVCDSDQGRRIVRILHNLTSRRNFHDTRKLRLTGASWTAIMLVSNHKHNCDREVDDRSASVRRDRDARGPRFRLYPLVGGRLWRGGYARH